MTQEEIIKLAHTAGFNWPDIQATTIERRLERFASLVAATEREKFTNTQEFVTLPREVVEQALKVLEYAANDVLTGRNAATALRAALEQPQVGQEPVARVVGTGHLGGHFDWCKPGLESPDLPSGTPLYTHPKPQCEPLTGEQARRIYHSETHAAPLAVFMTRMDAEHPDADDKSVSGWLQEAEYRVKSRIT